MTVSVIDKTPEDTSRFHFSQRQRKYISRVVAALLVIAVLSIPFINAFSKQNENWHFTGFLLFVEDGNSYLGKMRLGAQGDFNFHLFYTSEAHDGVSFLYLPHLITGWIVGQIVPETSPNHTQALIIGYHVLRIIADILYLMVLWRFITVFLKTNRAQYSAFLFATLGGGLGWLFMIAGQTDWLGGGLGLPPEFYIPEGFSTILLFGLPHLALSRAAMLLGFLLIFRAIRIDTHWIRYSIGAGLSWLTVALGVPFYLAVLAAVLGMWGILIWVQQRQFPFKLAVRGGIAFVITLPLLFYLLISFSQNPAFALWSSQNILISSSPLGYLVGYGLLAFLALLAIGWAFRKGKMQSRYLLLVGWVLIVPVLVYLPINVQRRLSEGVIVPLAILAAFGLERLAQGRKWIFILSWFIISLSSIFFLAGSILNSMRTAPITFRPAVETHALNWLNQIAPVNAVILTGEDTGNIIPAWTHLRSYIGHGMETLDWTRKRALVEAFYTGALDAEQRTLLLSGECLPRNSDLCSDPIDYIWVGPLEHENYADINLSLSDEWEIIYDEQGYTIYGQTTHE